MDMTRTQPQTITLFGIAISRMTMRETVAYLISAVQARRTTQVVTANPIMMMTAFQDPAYYAMLQGADVVVPDGAGLVWAASRLHKPVQERVAGYDLVQQLFQVGAEQAWTFYFLGASQDVVEAAKARAIEAHPGLRVIGCRDGYFTPQQDEDVIQDIIAAAPDVLLVGRSVYTQDPWIAQYRERLGIPVMIGVGGSFDVMSGKLRRAPRWMQRLRLEWLFRLLQQPSRFPRMISLPKFVIRVLLYGEKLQKR
jgi:N-acetylglucosaminyldiphosphoundecaprenol N-acetyl-beta-D-mannosaminyltransferase